MNHTLETQIYSLDNSRLTISKQIQYLEQELDDNLSKYRNLSKEIEFLEHNIHDFMEMYIKEVGTIYEEVSTPKMPPAHNDNNIGDIKSKKLNRDQQVKQLYRKLVKTIHPDITHEDSEVYTGMFMNLTKCYTENNLSGMMVIENILNDHHNIHDENVVEKLERLEKQHAHVLNDLDNLKIHRNKIINSSPYKLQQKATWHKICGDDFIEIVKENIQKQLNLSKSPKTVV